MSTEKSLFIRFIYIHVKDNSLHMKINTALKLFFLLKQIELD